MKTFVANGPLSVDVDDFKMNTRKRISITTSPTKVTYDISGSFSVLYKNCDGVEIPLDDDLCIVSRKRIITGCKVEVSMYRDDYATYSFTATDINPYCS